MRRSSFRLTASGLLLATCLVAALAGLAAPALCGDDRSDAPRDKSRVTVTTKGIDPPARWADRHDAERARLAIRTEDGNAELLLTREVVAVQLTDRGLTRVRKQLRADGDRAGDHNPLGWLEEALLAAVGSFLSHSAECDLDDVRDARYAGGRIVLVTNDGKELFAHIDVHDREVLSSFSADDARRFVRKFHHLKGDPS